MPHAIDAQLLLQHRHLAAGRPGRTHAVLRLQAAGQTDRPRPPLDLLACIDVSGSMEGRKLEEVKRALLALARELGAQDRLGLTTFESGVRQVLPPTRMDAEGKARLREAALGLWTAGSTFMSGGLLGAVSDLREAPGPQPEAVRRVLLFTDGHANQGLAEADREAWAALLRDRLEGLSVSWFGFGEDHDADFLSFLADRSRGNAYVARDADAITDAFAQELGGLLGVRAMDLALEFSVPRGELRLLNDERSEGRDGRLVVRVDDLSCEERKELVLELTTPPHAADAALPVRVVARWRDALTGETQETTAEARLGFGEGPGDAPLPEVQEAVALVFAANAQQRARAFAEAGRWRDAAEAIAAAVAELQRLDTPRARLLTRHLTAAIADYGDRTAYLSQRSRLKSMERTMSKQRSSGSEVDGEFINAIKAKVVRRIKEPLDEAPAVNPRLVRQLEQELAELFRGAVRRAPVSRRRKGS